MLIYTMFRIHFYSCAGLLLLGIFVSSCQKEEGTPALMEQMPPQLVEAPAPFTVPTGLARYYKDIAYDSYAATVFDLFIPNAVTNAPLVILIHGGGFTAGDKSDFYTSAEDQQRILDLLSAGTAVALINYRLLEMPNSVGLFQPFSDARRSLQYMRTYSLILNIDAERVALFGTSAGAGCALWLAANDDLSIPQSADRVARASTRVRGVAVSNAQATYDILEWPDTIFAPFQDQGFDFQYIVDLMGLETILSYYGVAHEESLNQSELKIIASSLDLLRFITSDDPEIYVENSSIANVLPATTAELYHHPLHVSALKQKGDAVGLVGKYYAPQIDIDTRAGESQVQFLLRVLQV